MAQRLGGARREVEGRGSGDDIAAVLGDGGVVERGLAAEVPGDQRGVGARLFTDAPQGDRLVAVPAEEVTGGLQQSGACGVSVTPSAVAPFRTCGHEPS
jgi:hypothetical protein